MTRRLGGPARTLPEGVYEDLVTHELARALAAATSERVVDPLDDADAHVTFGRHVGALVARALSGVPAERAHELTTKLLEHLASLVGEELAEQIRDQQPQPPPSRLMALHRGAIPARPTSPLATSTLLTRKRLDPTLGHELAREIATADEVDAIIAFVTVGGVRAIHEALHDFARRPAPRLRLLTTTFTGTTEVAALDTFARLPGAQVRVSYDTRRTRLHAKAWLFRRHTGLTTAYIGSANLTSTALGAGQEWMVKVCAADLPHVIEQFTGTFDTLWSEPEFEPYAPDDAGQRARLTAALSTEPASPDAFLVALHALPFQEIILDKLAAERAIHGRRRNLVVAATGTGKTVIAALDYVRQLAATGVAPRLTQELRELATADQGRPTLARFLDETGRDLGDVYGAGGWTTLQRGAGVADLAEGEDAAEIDELSRRLGRLQHVDEPDRLRSYRDILAAAVAGQPHAWTAHDRRRLLMLDSQLSHRGVLRAAEETATYLARRPTIVRELDELREVLEDRVGLAHQVLPVPGWSLALHCHYSRREILAGIGYVTAGDKVISLQAGILKLEDQRRELLFVTLDKSGKSFSPTTRYRDYASSPERFHWETQAMASVSRDSGRRYLDSATNGWTFFLFVRPDPDATFAFLGPIAYEAHTGDRPIAITWRLATPMPAILYERYATLRPG